MNLYRKGILSIFIGVLVLITMIGASYFARSKDPNMMYEDYVLAPPGIHLLKMFTTLSEKESIDKQSPLVDEDSENLIGPYSEVELPVLLETDSIASLADSGDKEETSPKFLFGTDHLGRDVFIRVAAASATYLLPCFIAVLIALLLGTILGTLSGFFINSWISTSSRMLQDVVRSIPVFVGIIVVMSAIKIDIYILMISFGVLISPRIAVLVEQQIFTLRQNDFVVAAIEMGIPTYVIILKHIILYNCLPLLFAQAAFTYAEAVLIETSLGFLGIGAMGNDLSWGFMVKSGLYEFIIEGNLWISLFPTLAILISIIGFQSLGNGLISYHSNKYNSA